MPHGAADKDAHGQQALDHGQAPTQQQVYNALSRHEPDTDITYLFYEGLQTSNEIRDEQQRMHAGGELATVLYPGDAGTNEADASKKQRDQE